MKTYEEMTHDVLQRRDNEINIRNKRRKNALKIGIPSVITAAAVTGIVAANVPTREKYIQSGVVWNANSHTSAAEITSENTSPAAPDNPLATPDNPLVTPDNTIKPTNIVFNNSAPATAEPDIYLNNEDFEEYTLDEMNKFYGLKIDAFSGEYPEWTMYHGAFGIYAVKYPSFEDESGAYSGGRDVYWKQNIIYWDLGEKNVTVEVNKGNLPFHCVVYGGIGDDVSVINNTDVTLYHSTGKYPNGEPIDTYYARFMFNNCGFEITANGTTCGGITEDEFIKIVELYTTPHKMELKPGEIPDNTSKSEEIVINDSLPDGNAYDFSPSPDDFNEFSSVEAMNNYYGFNIDAFSNEHLHWSFEHAALGTYVDEGSDSFSAWYRPYWKENNVWWRLGEKMVGVTVNDDELPHHCGELGSGGEKLSTINNVYVGLYRDNGIYFARFILNSNGKKCGFEISAKGVSEEEFIDIVRLYTDTEKMAVIRENQGDAIPL